MTKQQQHIMHRILEKKRCVRTGRLLSNIKFGIAVEEIEGDIYYALYRWVDDVRDTHPLVSSTSIHDVYVYLRPANAKEEE